MAQQLKIVFNPFSGKFDYINGAKASIPEYTVDPVSPAPEDAWVLHDGFAVVGSPIGLLLSLTYAVQTSGQYRFSYRTLEGTTVRVPLT